MVLSIDERNVREFTCPSCGPSRKVTGYVNADGAGFCVYFAECHGHPDHEAWIDVILGTWGSDDPRRETDHVTFSCQFRADGAMAVDAPVTVEPGAHPVLGRLLRRDEALQHPWIDSFWKVIDLIAESDDEVRRTVYEGS